MKAAEFFAPLTKLGRLARNKGREHGFAMHSFAAMPSIEGDGAAHAYITYLVVDEIMEDRAKADADAEHFAQALQPGPEADSRADEARQRLVDLEQRLRDPKKGILDD